MKRQTGLSSLSEILDVSANSETVNVRIVNGFNLPTYVALSITDTSSTEDTVDYYSDSLGGTIVATVLITYTSTAKTSILSAERTL